MSLKKWAHDKLGLSPDDKFETEGGNIAELRIDGKFFNVDISGLSHKKFQNIKVVCGVDEEANKAVAIYSKGNLLGKVAHEYGIGLVLDTDSISSSITAYDLFVLSQFFIEKYRDIGSKMVREIEQNKSINNNVLESFTKNKEEIFIINKLENEFHVTNSTGRLIKIIELDEHVGYTYNESDLSNDDKLITKEAFQLLINNHRSPGCISRETKESTENVLNKQ